MTEETIINFPELLRNHFAYNSQDEYVFSSINICYYNESRESQNIFIPFIMLKKFYSVIFHDDILNMKRTIFLEGTIDKKNPIELAKEHLDVVAMGKAIILTDEDLKDIAEENGYDNIKIKYICGTSSPNFLDGFYRIYEFYGIKKDKKRELVL